MTIQFHSMKTTNNIPQGYKNSPLGIIPQEWEVKKLGDVAESFSGGTPKAGNNEYYDGIYLLFALERYIKKILHYSFLS